MYKSAYMVQLLNKSNGFKKKKKNNILHYIQLLKCNQAGERGLYYIAVKRTQSCSATIR